MDAGNSTEISGDNSFAELQKWQLEKLREKKDECHQVIQNLHDWTSPQYSHSNEHCSPVWDNVMCWPAAKAGEVVSLPCPDYVHNFNPKEFATKNCTDNGTWFINPATNTTWTNYKNCNAFHPDVPQMHHLLEEWLPVIKTISQIGYSVSLCTLIIAFIILISMKKLRCSRNILHCHLFVSFMLRAFMAILKDSLFIEGLGLPQSIEGFFNELPNWECKLVTSLWQYFILANYSWILMEGLYLHNLIFLAPFRDSSTITGYVLLGWGLPLPVVLTWVGCRIQFDDTLCWTSHHNNAKLLNIIRYPIIGSIVVNFLFFVNITRVLFVKLQSAVSIETRKYRYRKWAKSTLVLIPLFGVNYMLFMGLSYYIGVDPVIEVTYLFCDQFFASFQGFFVATLYCLLNGEVRSEIRRKWQGWRPENESKNIWIPLNIVSRLNHHRSTQEMGLSMGTSVVGAATPLTIGEGKQRRKDENSRRLDGEITEEQRIEIMQPD